MSKRLTDEDKIRINEVYAVCKNYSKTAQITGFSAASVKKYVIPDFESPVVTIPNIGDFNLMSIEDNVNFLKNFGHITQLTSQEKADIQNLWKELLV
jgi:hypothetical protein